jgi:uncharacterized membrane protein
MSYDFAAWVGLALRWLHVIAGIAWIGASFYFVWLDNSLTAPQPPDERVKGELWAVHGGGFYHSRKFMVAPANLPQHLHWFMWEAYTTWLSGFALLVLVFYLDARTYLIDPGRAALSPLGATAIGLSFVFGGLAVFEGLCRSPVGSRPLALGALWFLSLTLSGYVLTHIFSDRGAFIHVGAMIGTVMVANVFLVIIPGQRRMVAAMRAGEPVDPKWGAMGKQRSVQNNYMTLPVILIMISNHYPALTGGPFAWLCVALISAAGVAIRHFFNLRHVGRQAPGFVVLGVVLFAVVSLIASLKPRLLTPGAAAPTYAQVAAIVQHHCVMCHSQSPTHPGIVAPPMGVVLDSPQNIRLHAARIWDMAVASHAMPMGNETGMTDQERETLGRWIKAGARSP